MRWTLIAGTLWAGLLACGDPYVPSFPMQTPRDTGVPDSGRYSFPIDGQVTVEQSRMLVDNTQTQYELTAHFAGRGGLACSFEQLGACILETCAAETDGIDGGQVSVQGGLRPATVDVDEGGRYQVTRELELWRGGEALLAAGAGSVDVPRFSTEIRAPHAVTLTSPPVALSGVRYEIARHADLVVTWVPPPGLVGEPLLNIEFPESRGRVTALRCIFAGGENDQAIIPVSTMQRLPEGQATIHFQTRTRMLTPVINGSVEVTLLQTANTVNAGPVIGTIFIE